MADVRALLKAKRQEVRITHLYAAYGANGALRCTLCNTAIKSASAWERHLGTKMHRVFAANLEDIREGVESARRDFAKRKAEEDGDGDGDEGEGEQQVEMATATAMGKKRQRTEEREIAPPVVDASPDARTGGTGASHPAFPAGFFSDPARVPPRTSSIGGKDDDDDDEDVEMAHDQDAKAKTTGAAAPPPKSQFDAEWDAFERDMQSLSHQQQRQQQQRSSSSRPAAETAELQPEETSYAHATIAAEPELVSRFEGLPVVDGAPAAAQDGGTEAGAGAGIEEGGRRVLSEEELERRRKDRDERELIMDRLVEEERAQEDAYGRVALLKNRIQMLKQKRELAKEAKGKKVASDMET